MKLYEVVSKVLTSKSPSNHTLSPVTLFILLSFFVSLSKNISGKFPEGQRKKIKIPPVTP